jgi:HEPN domain-containing protein
MSGDDLELAGDRRRIAQRWLSHSMEDLRVARVCLTMVPPSFGTAAYLCQQAAEKAVKGLLVMADIPFTKTHDLQRLGTLAAPHYSECDAALVSIHALTAWNSAYRYPELDEPSEPSLDEIEEAMRPIGVSLARLADVTRDDAIEHAPT